MAALNPGVALVAVNPPKDVTDSDGISVVRGGMLPLKSRSMRGVVLGKPYADDPAWVREAAGWCYRDCVWWEREISRRKI